MGLTQSETNGAPHEFFSSLSWLEIDLNQIKKNTRWCLHQTGVPIMSVVKANAYGYGAEAVAKAQVEAGVSWFAVAQIQEAITLRKSGIAQPILVLLPGFEDSYAPAEYYRLSLSLNSFSALERMAVFCQRQKTRLNLHLKFDTGMGRFGFRLEEIPVLIRLLHENPQLHVEAVYSHYAEIDEEPQSPLNDLQKARFDEGLAMLRQGGIAPEIVHFSNSAAALSSPETRYSIARMGSVLLGMNPFYYQSMPPELRAAIAWKSRLLSTRRLPAGYGIGYGQTYTLKKDSFVGAVPVGYGDGMSRVGQNEFLIRGKRVPVIGRICCDVSMVLLPDYLPEGEAVTILGRQGDEEITVEELASRWKTSRAAVTSGITFRVERRYEDFENEGQNAD